MAGGIIEFAAVLLVYVCWRRCCGKKGVGVTRGLGEDAGGLKEIREPVDASSASLIPCGIDGRFGSLSNLGFTLLKPMRRESFGFIGISRLEAGSKNGVPFVSTLYVAQGRRRVLTRVDFVFSELYVERRTLC